MIGKMIIGEMKQKTIFRIGNVDDFEGYMNALDADNDSEDVLFTGWLDRLRTPEFNRANRDQYDSGTDFKQDFAEIICNNYKIPTSGRCFIKCNIHQIGKNYTENFLTFILTEQRRSYVLTIARIQPFCKSYNNNIGCYDDTRINPRKLQKKISLYMYKNHFSLDWKISRSRF